MNTRVRPVLLALLLLAGAAAPARADVATIQTRFAAAVERYEQAARALARSPESSKQSLLYAAAEFESIAASPELSPFERARAQYNLACSSLLAGDRPRAVLNFRRAQLVAPTLQGLNDNLAIARDRAAPRSASSPPASPAKPTPRELVLNWSTAHLNRLPASIYTFAAAALGLLAACVLSLRIVSRRPSRSLTWTLAPLLLLAGVCAAAYVLVTEPLRRCHDAVVIASGVTAHTQPELTAPAASLAPALAAELTILETRAEWSRVAAVSDPSTASGWVPTSCLERVVP